MKTPEFKVGDEACYDLFSPGPGNVVRFVRILRLTDTQYVVGRVGTEESLKFYRKDNSRVGDKACTLRVPTDKDRLQRKLRTTRYRWRKLLVTPGNVDRVKEFLDSLGVPADGE